MTKRLDAHHIDTLRYCAARGVGMAMLAQIFGVSLATVRRLLALPYEAPADLPAPVLPLPARAPSMAEARAAEDGRRGDAAGKRGRPTKTPAGDGRMRRCLGPDCGIMFASTHNGNRLCPTCAKRVAHRRGGLVESGSTGGRVATRRVSS